MYAEDSNMRGIVFVRTRVLAECIASWIEKTTELQHIKALKYTGAQAQISKGGKPFKIDFSPFSHLIQLIITTIIIIIIIIIIFKLIYKLI
jgi:hypothetical protein